jgi:cardiolipin synthase (CMP-forming)
LQIGLVAVSLLLAGFELDAPVALTALVWLVAATTLGSGGAYVWVTVRRR